MHYICITNNEIYITPLLVGYLLIKPIFYARFISTGG